MVVTKDWAYASRSFGGIDLASVRARLLSGSVVGSGAGGKSRVDSIRRVGRASWVPPGRLVMESELLKTLDETSCACRPTRPRSRSRANPELRGAIKPCGGQGRALSRREQVCAPGGRPRVVGRGLFSHFPRLPGRFPSSARGVPLSAARGARPRARPLGQCQGFLGVSRFSSPWRQDNAKAPAAGTSAIATAGVLWQRAKPTGVPSGKMFCRPQRVASSRPCPRLNLGGFLAGFSPILRAPGRLAVTRSA